MTVWAVFGTAGGVLALADACPYIRDVLRGSTSPERLTWTIWSVLSWVVVVSQRADGAGWSLIMALAQALLTTIVFVLSLSRGAGGWSAVEVLMGAVAGAGVAGWFIASDPTIATGCVVLADAIGVAAMLPKSWHDPDSETAVTYALAAASGGCAAVAVGRLDASLLLYPCYFLLANALLAAVLFIARRHTSDHVPRPFRHTLGP